jgi:putative ABC transport system permease protein
VGLVLALVATTTLMAVQDRAVEHAVLQAIGFSGQRVFGLVLSEGMLLSLAGGLLGIGAAVVLLLVYPIALSTEGAVLALTSSPSLALEGALVSLVVGLVAGTIPALQAARADIVPALRQG